MSIKSQLMSQVRLSETRKRQYGNEKLSLKNKTKQTKKRTKFCLSSIV